MKNEKLKPPTNLLRHVYLVYRDTGRVCNKNDKMEEKSFWDTYSFTRGTSLSYPEEGTEEWYLLPHVTTQFTGKRQQSI